MLNAVGREIPEEILERTGKEVFQGNNYKDGKAFQKASPKVTPVMRNDHDKMVKDIHEALVKCNAHDGMTVSFHHHFREGDLVVCMVMEEIHKMGFKNITLSASSLGKAHDALVPMIEDGTILNIESSGVRGKIGDDYYYVNSKCEVVRDCDYYISWTHDLMPQGRYHFDADGKLTGSAAPLKNGIYEEDGSLYFYRNGERTYAGLIQIDGDYYYVRSSCEVVHDRSYYVYWTHGLMPEGYYNFDSAGRMILDSKTE